jgi:hypothetical protein
MALIGMNKTPTAKDFAHPFLGSAYSHQLGQPQVFDNDYQQLFLRKNKEEFPISTSRINGKSLYNTLVKRNYQPMFVYDVGVMLDRLFYKKTGQRSFKGVDWLHQIDISFINDNCKHKERQAIVYGIKWIADNFKVRSKAHLLGIFNAALNDGLVRQDDYRYSPIKTPDDSDDSDADVLTIEIIW